MAINSAPWCSGSTSHFDCDGMGSNPVGAVWDSWFESSYPSSNIKSQNLMCMVSEMITDGDSYEIV